MDWNLVTMSGRLTAPVEIRTLNSGAVMARYLLTVVSDFPAKRVDIIPVSQWDPPSEVANFASGTRLLAVGSMQRRFWDEGFGAGSNLEFVATHVGRPCES